jgi:signal transduction histidine kinase
MLNYWKHLLQSFSASHRLSRRLLAYILACSTVFALISTLLQLGWDYHSDVNVTKERINEIQTTNAAPIAASVWNMDNEQLALQLKGLQKIPDIMAVTVYERIDNHLLQRMQVGQTTGLHVLNQRLPLTYEDFAVGELEISLTLEPVYDRLWQKSLVILIAQTIKTMLVSCFILLILYHYLIRHLHTITAFLQQLNISTSPESLTLDRPTLNADNTDDLDAIVNSINDMQKRHAHDWQAQQIFADDLQREHAINKELNEQLEQKVALRTQSLETSHRDLQTAYDNLKNAQQALIESEKMASLGALVSGMANELNTPLGISMTAGRFLSSRLKDFSTLPLQDTAGNNSWQSQLAAIHESTELIQLQTQKAMALLTNFQQIALTHSNPQASHFNVAETLHQIIVSQGHRLTQQHCHMAITCDPTLEMQSYLSAFSRICNHLIQNSLDHGFEHCNRPRNITIKVHSEAGWVKLDYQDNGQGIDAALLPHIFEPFVTSRREQGFSGLGGYIIYNQVVQLLGGKINCQSQPGHGVHFAIEIPQHII